MTPDQTALELMARGVAIGATATLGAGLWASQAGKSVRIAGALFSASVIAYAINSSPILVHAVGWVEPLIHFMALAGAGLFWMFIVALFEDRPLSWTLFAPWALLTGVGLLGMTIPTPQNSSIWVVHNLIEAALGAHALFVIVRSWRGDLVEVRRRLRGAFLTVVTLYVITLSGFEIAEIEGYFQVWFRLLGASTLAAYCLAGAIVFLRGRAELFGAAVSAGGQATGGVVDGADRAAIEALNRLMAEGEAWRREGLTIGALADEVGLPEHRLRRLINDRLGFRNFAAFVNDRRIDAAKRLLTDPAKARVTVASIAYDLGFGSLGPFNRAFKEATGLTPTEWRRARSSPNPENPG